ncbi:MAG: glycosyl hydrolase family 8 [Succinivibrio sp.]
MKLVNTLLLTAALGCSASAWSKDWPLYDSFMALHYSDGRIIDHQKDGDVVTSEGLSYGMFMALIQKDKDRFDRMLAFVKKELCRNDPTNVLPAWKYVSGKITDENNATDSDLFIAYDLIEAARIFNDEAYLADAEKILNLVKKNCVYSNKVMGKLLTPGRYGFVKSNEFSVNPSYFPPFVMQKISAFDPDFAEYYHDTVQAVVKGSGDGYCADFLTYSTDGALIVKKSTKGSYDAVRYYLWLGITSDSDPNKRILLPLYENMFTSTAVNLAVPENYSFYFHTENGRGNAAFDAALLNASSYKVRDYLRTRLKNTVFGRGDYYSHALTVFATGNDERRFALDADGSVILGE